MCFGVCYAAVAARPTDASITVLAILPVLTNVRIGCAGAHRHLSLDTSCCFLQPLAMPSVGTVAGAQELAGCCAPVIASHHVAPPSTRCHGADPLWE